MTASQYRALLSRLGLSQVGAAKLLRVGDRTSRRWAQNGVTGTAAVVLRLLEAGTISVEDIEAVHKK